MMEAPSDGGAARQNVAGGGFGVGATVPTVCGRAILLKRMHRSFRCRHTLTRRVLSSNRLTGPIHQKLPVDFVYGEGKSLSQQGSDVLNFV